MAPQTPRRQPTNPVRLRCERFEDRATPAQFTVQPALTFSAGTLNNNGCVVVADFNKDGVADAAMTNQGGSTIAVLRGLAAGGFTASTVGTGGTNNSFASVADLNNDTFPDLLVTNGNNQNTGSVSVFRNDGQGNLVLQGTPFSTFGNNAAWVGTADVTGDGVLDAVVANFGRKVGTDQMTGNNVTVFQGLGNFAFAATAIATLSPTIQGIPTFVPTSLAVADFDGDGIVDIAGVSQGIPPEIGAAYPEGYIYLFRGTGAGGFAAPNAIDTGGLLPVNLQVGDVTGDGKKDLVVSNAGDPGDTTTLHFLWTGSSVSVFPNVSTSGTVQFGIPNILTANIRGAFATSLTDFNLDGRTDIAAVNFGAPTFFTVAAPENASVALFLQSSTTPGVFTAASPGKFDTLTSNAGGQYLAAGDFDHNGSPDLIVAHGDTSVAGNNTKVGLLLNTSVAVTRPTVTGVAVNAGQANAAQRSKVTSLRVTFNTQVTFAGTVAAAFTVSRINGGAVGGFTASSAVVGGVTVVTLTGFSGAETEFGSLADGRYVLTALANQITAGGLQLDGDGNGTSGDNYVLTGTTANGLFRLFGDVNGDGSISGGDFGTFRLAFGLTSSDPGYLDFLDYDGNGAISGGDFGQFRIRFGTTVP